MGQIKEKKITNEKPISLAGADFKKLVTAFLASEAKDRSTQEEGG